MTRMTEARLLGRLTVDRNGMSNFRCCNCTCQHSLELEEDNSRTSNSGHPQLSACADASLHCKAALRAKRNSRRPDFTRVISFCAHGTKLAGVARSTLNSVIHGHCPPSSTAAAAAQRTTCGRCPDEHSSACWSRNNIVAVSHTKALEKLQLAK